MSITSDFYLARAQDCAQEAAATGLANVRDQRLRAEAAWLLMAERLIRIEDNKKRGAEIRTAAEA